MEAGVHGQEQSLFRGRLDAVQGDDPGLHGDGPVLFVDVEDLLEPGQGEDHAARLGRDGPARGAGAAAARDHAELHLVGEPHDAANLLLGLGKEHEHGQLHAQVRGVGGGLDAAVGLVADGLAVHEGFEPADDLGAEGELGVVALPEQLDGHGQDLGEGAVDERLGHVQPPLHGLAHQLGIDEGIVAHQEEFGGQVAGELLHIVGPVLVALHVDHAQGAGDELLIGNGNMGTELGHVFILREFV